MIWWLVAGVAVVAWCAGALSVIAVSRRRQQRIVQSCLKLRHSVEPYLRRRAEELQLDSVPAATSPTESIQEVVTCICALTDSLLTRERDQLAMGDTLNMISDTLPLRQPDGGSEPRPTRNQEQK